MNDIPKNTSELPKILIVDDEETVLKSLNRILRREYRVTLAQTAAAGFEALEQDQDYTLILCDLVMPVENGQLFYNRVISQWPDLEPKFLFFTGGAYAVELQEFADRMKDRTLLKPLQLLEITSAIKSYIQYKEVNR